MVRLHSEVCFPKASPEMLLCSCEPKYGSANFFTIFTLIKKMLCVCEPKYGSANLSLHYFHPANRNHFGSLAANHIMAQLAFASGLLAPVKLVGSLLLKNMQNILEEIWSPQGILKKWDWMNDRWHPWIWSCVYIVSTTWEEEQS